MSKPYILEMRRCAGGVRSNGRAALGLLRQWSVLTLLAARLLLLQSLPGRSRGALLPERVGARASGSCSTLPAVCTCCFSGQDSGTRLEVWVEGLLGPVWVWLSLLDEPKGGRETTGDLLGLRNPRWPSAHALFRALWHQGGHAISGVR